MPGRVRQKWRPPLALVVGGTLAAVLALPMAGVWALLRLGRSVGDGTAVLMVALAVGVATLVLGYLLWRLIWGPVTALADRAQQVAEGRAGAAEPLAHYGTEELGRLGQRMLDMEAALRSREATVRAFADHVTHELKTPLTAIRGAAELLEGGTLADGDRRLAVTIREAAARMEAELAALRRVALAREPRHHGSCRAAGLLPELAEAFPGLVIDLTGGEVRLPLAADGLRVVLTQLLGNAAAHGASRVAIRAEPGALTVEDDGPGISEGNRARVFDPFFTTRRESGGTGMGLPIARALLEAHGAGIALCRGTGPGTAFRITF